jgi:hypothetical protein
MYVWVRGAKTTGPIAKTFVFYGSYVLLIGFQTLESSTYSFVGERPYLSTKIITLSEFFNFVHQVSRL